jgi:hypothetical protein
MMKRMIIIALVALTFVISAILSTQAVFFYYIFTNEKPLEKADLLVAFQGSSDRANEVYKLIDGNYASNLVISPANNQQLKAYESKFSPSQSFGRIVENKARTTFENAVYTQRIIESNNFKSVILVTSWYHMPRSYVLLKTMLIGSHIHIQPHKVDTGTLNHENWYRHIVGWKMVYNEMVELWGSALEYLRYRINGNLSEKVPGRSGFMGWLKQLLLFKIDHKSLLSAHFKDRSA